MANNADVDYIIICHDKAVINELAEVLERGCKESPSNAYNAYKAIELLGIDTEPLSLRMDIQSVNKDYVATEISLQSICAWGHQRDFDKALKDKYGDKVEVYFEEYEPGCGVFSTNDMSGKVFKKNYVVDCDCEEEFHLNEQEVAEYYKEVLGEFPDGVEVTHEMLMERAEAYNEANKDDDCKFIYIHRLSREED